MFGSQIHALPVINIYQKKLSIIYQNRMPGIYIQYPLSQVLIVSEILVPGSGDQCNSIPLS